MSHTCLSLLNMWSWCKGFWSIYHTFKCLDLPKNGNFEKKIGQTLKLILDPLNFLLKFQTPYFFVRKFETPLKNTPGGYSPLIMSTPLLLLLQIQVLSVFVNVMNEKGNIRIQLSTRVQDFGWFFSHNFYSTGNISTDPTDKKTLFPALSRVSTTYRPSKAVAHINRLSLFGISTSAKHTAFFL